MNKILGFKDKYRFLSNFYFSSVEFDNVVYPTLEHAYQASKTKSSKWRRRILNLDGPGKAKKFVRQENFPFDSDFHNKKIEIMEMLVREKFKNNNLKQQLLETGDSYIEETNEHKDDFWGVYKGKGENNLGKILMKIRDELKCQKEN